jgi:2-iminobutanoate/2-iminopropanoate deaminase
VKLAALTFLVAGASLGVMSMEQQQASERRAPGELFSPAVARGGFVFVSALDGTGPNGLPAADDVAAQTRRVLERLRGVLEASGSSIAQTVSVYVYLRAASDFEAMNEVYREVFADKPPVRTTVVAGLPPGLRVVMSAIAVPAGADREVLHPAGWMKSPRPYSYIVRANGLVFLSGLISRRGVDDQPVPGPVTTQVKTILDNAGTLLRTAGLDYSDVVAARVYVADDSFFEEMNDEYRQYFPIDPPARATAVASLMGSATWIEISFIASTMEKKVMGPVVSPSLPLSTAVRTGSLTFLSGVLGNTDKTKGNVAAQTRETLARIGRTLEAAGFTPADVVDNLVYMPDIWQRPEMTPAHREFFGATAPAGTLVGAKLITPDGLIEMMMTCVRR